MIAEYEAYANHNNSRQLNGYLTIVMYSFLELVDEG